MPRNPDMKRRVAQVELQRAGQERGEARGDEPTPPMFLRGLGRLRQCNLGPAARLRAAHDERHD
eukprot:993245-Prorocentrum_minimum.AAC.1